MAVYARTDETFESLYKRFKKQVQNSGVLQDLRKREYYVPKSEKRRKKHEQALKRVRKTEKKLDRFDY